MAENDQKNDPPFSSWFSQLEILDASVLDVTIRALDASEISWIFLKNVKYHRPGHYVKKVAVSIRVPAIMSVETISERL